MNPDKPQLSTKKAAFCAEYLIDLNATQAAIRAGYSAKTARSQAQRLLTNVDIQQEISRLTEERALRVQIDADTVLREILKVALADIGQAFKEDGSLKAIQDMPEEIRRAIAGVDVFEEFEGRGEEREQIGFTKKIRFWDKTKALELLGRHLRLFSDKLEVTGKDGTPLDLGQPRPSAEEVTRFSRSLHEGFTGYRDSSGESATIDAESLGKLAEITAQFAAGESPRGTAEECGRGLAKLQCMRRALKGTMPGVNP